jgi:flagellar basal body-associated protein fliL
MDFKKFTVLSIVIFVLSLLVFVATLVLVVFKPTGNSQNAPKKEKKEATQNIDVGDITTQIGQAGRFYKGFVVLEVKGKKTPETIKAKMPQIKDSIITSISAMTPNEIASPEGMSKLKEKIKNDANAIIESETKDVVSVLFTESIIQ